VDVPNFPLKTFGVIIMMEVLMTLTEQLQKQLGVLPPEKQSEVLDFVTFLQERTRSEGSVFEDSKRRERLKKAFETLATLGAFAYINDPVDWQRQMRKDRPFPGREE
jgi:hypothetical protein